jgi:hypothetical protein
LNDWSWSFWNEMSAIMNVSRFVWKRVMRIICATNASDTRRKTQFSDVKRNEKARMISLYIESSNMNDD